MFSLYEPDALRDMMGTAGFREIEVRRTEKALRVAPPAEFMWQYACSTPIAGVLAGLDERRRAALEQDVRAQCRPYCTDGAMALDVPMTTAIARA